MAHVRADNDRHDEGRQISIFVHIFQIISDVLKSFLDLADTPGHSLSSPEASQKLPD